MMLSSQLLKLGIPRRRLHLPRRMDQACQMKTLNGPRASGRCFGAIPYLSMRQAGRSCYRPLLLSAGSRRVLPFHLLIACRISDLPPCLWQGECIAWTYFHAQSSSPVQWLHQRPVGFPTARFCRSPAYVGNSLGSFTFIRQGFSHVVLERPPLACRRHRSWIDPKDTS